MQDRWTHYGGPPARITPGWSWEEVVAPSELWGANGIVWSGPSELMVTQVFGNQVTAIDVDTGAERAFAAIGGGIAAPDDGAFGADGTFFATEPMNATVSARGPDGTYRTLRDDLPGANGMTVSHDRRRLFVDEFRPGGRLLELDPAGEREPVVLADDLAMPNAFAMGPDGALWFPQVLAGEIWRYDLDARTLERRLSDLATPTAVKFDTDGRLLTSEAGSGHLTAIDIASGARQTLAEVNPGIDNFAIGDGGRLFVSHFTDGRVAEVTGGTERVLARSGLIGPFGLSRLPDGSVASADGLAVNRTSPDGTPRVVASLLADLPGLAIDVAQVDGEILVLLERGQVMRLGADGSVRSVAGHLAGATAMTEWPGGGALVVEAGAGRVIHIDGAGDVLGEVVTGLTEPRAVAVAPAEASGPGPAVWVTHPGGATGFVDGRPVGRIEGIEDPHGIGLAAGPGADGVTAVVAEPARRALVAVDLGSGRRADVVTDAPIGSPVAGNPLPHAFSPVHGDGDGFLIGCDGDGSIRRLTVGA
jgi:sugar lactone lactonase YvrE